MTSSHYPANLLWPRFAAIESLLGFFPAVSSLIGHFVN